MEPHPTATLEAEMSLVHGRPGGPPELVIRYDGTAPPTDLFAALEELGCGHAVVEPPPRSAIDWSRPDPRRGTRYTIEPYAATTRLELPASAPAQLLDRVAPIAERNGVRVSGLPPAAESPGGEVEVVVLVDPAREATLAAAVDGLARCIEREVTEVVRTNTYRGRTCETTVPVIGLVLVVERDRLDDLVVAVSPLAAGAPRVVEPPRDTSA